MPSKHLSLFDALTSTRDEAHACGAVRTALEDRSPGGEYIVTPEALDAVFSRIVAAPAAHPSGTWPQCLALLASARYDNGAPRVSREGAAFLVAAWLRRAVHEARARSRLETAPPEGAAHTLLIWFAPNPLHAVYELGKMVGRDALAVVAVQTLDALGGVPLVTATGLQLDRLLLTSAASPLNAARLLVGGHAPEEVCDGLRALLHALEPYGVGPFYEVERRMARVCHM